MIPRRDPKTRPQTASVQLIRRRSTDQYGTDKGRPDIGGPRLFETRNGLPEPCYDPANRPRRLPPAARRELDRAWAYNQRWPERRLER